LVVRRQGGGYGGNNDILLDLRVDDHPNPVPELGRIHAIHQLLFGRTPQEQWLPVEGELASEVERRLASLGRSSLEEWAGMENLEERVDPAGERIDPVVLQVLREQTAAATAPPAAS
jgi:uncharacterized Ntn-hydrolase superfamily protein